MKRSVIWIVTGLINLLIPTIATAQEFIPRDALKYQRDIIRNSRLYWGLDAPVATFAAQIHQESRWRPDAKSAFAGGLAQFTPSTANWIAGVYPNELGDNQPYNPIWALRALVLYDKHLWDRTRGADNCERMAFTLSKYNGGPGWAEKDRKLAEKMGSDPSKWFGHTEKHNSGRAKWAFEENRGYPQRILFKLEKLYASWGQGVQCYARG